MDFFACTLFRCIFFTLLASTKLAAALSEPTKFPGVLWDDENWIITSQELRQGAYQDRLSLANGYLGITVAATGPFFEVDVPVEGDNINGWPIFDRRQTFATVAGFFNSQDPANETNYPWLNQYGGESFISGVPHWAGLVVQANGAILNASVNPAHISEYSSTLDIGAGLLSWSYSWTPGGGEPIHVHYRMLVHKLHINQAAVQLKLTASRDANVTVYDVLEGDCALRTEFVDKKYETGSATIWSAVRPSNIDNVTAYIYSTVKGDEAADLGTRAEINEGDNMVGRNISSIAQSVKVNLVAGQTAEVSKFIGAASSDAFSDPQAIAKEASIAGASDGFTALLHSNIEEWKNVLPRCSVDSYHYPNGSLPTDRNIQEMQILAVTNPFHLLQNIVGPNAVAAAGNNARLAINSVPVCGLGSACYGGLIFWDADVWMAPGLQMSHPEHAQQFVNYRVDKFAQARQNVDMAFSSSQNHTSRFSAGGAVYPWTSGRYGNCTGTGPCFDYEYHLNGDIGLLFRNQYIATGDAKQFAEKLLPISNAIAHFYGEVVTFNETSGFYELWNATDPDEYANNKNNVGFTTALMKQHFQQTNQLNSWFGIPVNDSWTEKARRMRLPINKEARIILEYPDMNGSIAVKQADVVLIDDFLNYDHSYSLTSLDYYAAKQSPNGPGMTYAVFSVVANQISPSGCSSYTYDHYTSAPYLRTPWFQYSEQLLDNYNHNGGTHPAFPFLTGMGGANRVALFGYLGLRLLYDRLDIDPSLPPQIPHLNYRTFYWHGHAINATSNTTHTTLVRLPNTAALPSANTTFFTRPIPVSLGTRRGYFLLRPYKSPSSPSPLTLLNRQIGHIATVAGNIMQCHPHVTSSAPHLPGQFPLAAIDGAASTKWQPVASNETVYLSVELGAPYFPIRHLLFDWGAQPPLYFEVLFSNSSLEPRPPGWSSTFPPPSGIPLSRPFDPARAYVIEPIVGNQTNVTLGSVVWTGRWVVLGVRGNQYRGSGRDGQEIGGPTVAEWSLAKEEDGVDNDDYRQEFAGENGGGAQLVMGSSDEGGEQEGRGG
ncbi:acid trehalase [Massariosphaeria phaeospora]|uniref:alpha,alpha-trehalase n=1 Tax=Massariosphaeria phaeospora TaxID=100035 RepID=A0A7C8MLG0_9PLEO|nr:acid trehalase [Massariosphaeria phaeospora]